LDYVLDLARKYGLYVTLCIDSYNELRRASEGGYGYWDDTPHNAVNGGPRAWTPSEGKNPTTVRVSAEGKDSPNLRLYGMRGKTVSLIWVQNSMHNHSRIHATGQQPDPVPQTILTLPKWPAGNYRVVFWDTYEGKEIDTRSFTATASGLQVELPAIRKDIALKLTRADADDRRQP